MARRTINETGLPADISPATTRSRSTPSVRIERLLPSRTRIADVWLSVINCAARRIVTEPSQNTGGLSINSETRIVPSSGRAWTTWPVCTMRCRSDAAR